MPFEFGGKKIAVIDDDIVVLIGLKRAVRKFENCELIGFEVASDALEALLKQKVDAILCDVLLPDLDGLNLVRELRRSGANSDTPVVIVTGANADDVSFKEGDKAMNATIVLKPLTIDAIGAALSTLEHA
ncbi:MAG: response regulator [Alphaproteobacteria bacterium]